VNHNLSRVSTKLTWQFRTGCT